MKWISANEYSRDLTELEWIALRAGIDPNWLRDYLRRRIADARLVRVTL